LTEAIQFNAAFWCLKKQKCCTFNRPQKIVYKSVKKTWFVVYS